MVLIIIALLILMIHHAVLCNKSFLDNFLCLVKSTLYRLRTGDVFLETESLIGNPLYIVFSESVGLSLAKGETILRRLDLIKENIVRLQKLIVEARRLWRLLLFRFIFLLVGVFFIRIFFLSYYDSFLPNSYDFMSCFLAALLSCFILYSFYLVLPRIEKGESLDNLKNWIRVSLTLDPEHRDIWYEDLFYLEKKEIESGLSLEEEKLEKLREWAITQYDKERERLGRCEEFLPLFELFGGGLGCFLLILIPLVEGVSALL